MIGPCFDRAACCFGVALAGFQSGLKKNVCVSAGQQIFHQVLLFLFFSFFYCFFFKFSFLYICKQDIVLHQCFDHHPARLECYPATVPFSTSSSLWGQSWNVLIFTNCGFVSVRCVERKKEVCNSSLRRGRTVAFLTAAF